MKYYVHYILKECHRLVWEYTLSNAKNRKYEDIVRSIINNMNNNDLEPATISL